MKKEIKWGQCNYTKDRKSLFMTRKRKDATDLFLGIMGSLLFPESTFKHYKKSRYKTRKPRSKKSWL